VKSNGLAWAPWDTESKEKFVADQLVILQQYQPQQEGFSQSMVFVFLFLFFFLFCLWFILIVCTHVLIVIFGSERHVCVKSTRLRMTPEKKALRNAKQRIKSFKTRKAKRFTRKYLSRDDMAKSEKDRGAKCLDVRFSPCINDVGEDNFVILNHPWLSNEASEIQIWCRTECKVMEYSLNSKWGNYSLSEVLLLSSFFILFLISSCSYYVLLL